jgi:hypothetical protein
VAGEDNSPEKQEMFLLRDNYPDPLTAGLYCIYFTIEKEFLWKF